MVAPTGKTHHYKLTGQERRLCLEAMLTKRQKKATRKKAAKHTTLWMEMAESKDAEYVGECLEVVEAVEVKGVTAGEETVEDKETTTQEME
ncbi:Hypothetical protein PHPALM_19165, partial [Phytophthora palmivora]